MKNYLRLRLNIRREILGALLPAILVLTGCSHDQEIKTEPSEPDLAMALSSLQTQYQGLRQWSRGEGLRVGSFLSVVDPKFLGVRAFGNTLQDSLSWGASVADLTDSSSHYWRARMEMTPDDPSVILGKGLLLAYRGKMDHAFRQMNIAQILPFTEHGGNYAFPFLVDKLVAYRATRDSLIGVGIEAFDAGDRKKALEYYHGVLEVDPFCAFAWHEVYLCELTKSGNRVLIRGQYESQVYGSDPMYPMGILALDAEEGFRMSRRMEMARLLAEGQGPEFEMLDLADLALDVEAIAYAGDLYWTALLIGPESLQPECVDGFVSCLVRLEIEEIPDIFKGEPKDRIARALARQQERKNQDSFYKSMSKGSGHGAE